MWQNVDVDYEAFREGYEDWLEEEVWTYFDWMTKCNQAPDMLLQSLIIVCPNLLTINLQI